MVKAATLKEALDGCLGVWPQQDWLLEYTLASSPHCG
eukprot:CAMPEP_0172875716 /NCGR_PEP_ID=MMETSP1075-20121228/102534_1 /TAXON_ID=2916 /ORGANISM="Ceratium fusus, Strain PA161109" /LENGTH=36 /DNA_ID= /DNA_START= /DNA_END= /DNA_ORIENTATION=